jgi:putative transposase
MTATLDDVTARKNKPEPSASSSRCRAGPAGQGAGPVVVRPGRAAQTADQDGPGDRAHEEMTKHLGYEKHDPAGVGADNIRNGTRAKTVLTESTG